MRGWIPNIVSLRDVHSSNMYTTSELGSGESLLLNRASQINFHTNLNLLRYVWKLVVLPKVKAILPEVHYSLSPSSGKYLDKDGIFALQQTLSGGGCR